MEEKFDEILRKDPRYKLEAYFFVLAALDYTRKMTKKPKHVTGKELLEGIKRLGLEQYGIMTKTVFESWGVRTTRDFGEIVFNMVNAGILAKTEEDKIEDFDNVYDFSEVFEKNYQFGK
ncbi:MAG: Minf_1886 family protein [candidate division WOR-3 bacterium]